MGRRDVIMPVNVNRIIRKLSPAERRKVETVRLRSLPREMSLARHPKGPQAYAGPALPDPRNHQTSVSRLKNAATCCFRRYEKPSSHGRRRAHRCPVSDRSPIVVSHLAEGTSRRKSTRRRRLERHYIACTLDSMDFSLTNHQKHDSRYCRQFMETEVRAVRQGDGEEEKFRRRQSRNWARWAAAGCSYRKSGAGRDLTRFVCADAGRSGARVYGAFYRAGRDQFGGAGAAAAVLAPTRKRRNICGAWPREKRLAIFVYGPAAGSDARGNSSARRARWRLLQAQRNENLGDERQRRWRAAGFAENRSRAAGRVSGVSGGTGIRRLSRGRHEDKMGQRSSPSVEILLNDAWCRRRTGLGEEGQGLKIALSALDGGRIGMRRRRSGWRKARWKRLLSMRSSARSLGRRLRSFRAIQWMIADMPTEIERRAELVYYARG